MRHPPGDQRRCQTVRQWCTYSPFSVCPFSILTFRAFLLLFLPFCLFVGWSQRPCLDVAQFDQASDANLEGSGIHRFCARRRPMQSDRRRGRYGPYGRFHQRRQALPTDGVSSLWRQVALQGPFLEGL